MPSPYASDARSPKENLLVLLLGGALALRLAIANHPIQEIDALSGACFAVLGLGLAARHPQLPRYWIWLSVLFAALVGVSAWASPHRIVSIYAIPSWWFPGFVFGACALVPKSAVPRLVSFLAIPCTISAGTALYQRFVLWPETLQNVSASSELVARLSSGRPLGLSLSPDLGGAIALLGFFCALFHFRDAETTRKWLWAAPGGICLAGVVASASAGVALALGVFGGLTFAFWLLQNEQGPWRKSGWALFPLLPLAAMAILGRGPDALMRSMHERLWNWRVAWEAFGHSPVLGFGPGRFAAAYAQHRVPDANITRYAHSTFFHGLVELGGLGILVFLALVTVVVVGLALHSHQKRDDKDVVYHLMWAAGLALGLRWTFDYDAQIAQTACGLSAWWGLMWARLAPSTKRAPRGSPFSVQAFFGTGVIAFFVLAGALHSRNKLLSDTEGDAPIEITMVEQLQSHAERFPEDVHIAARLLKLQIDALNDCVIDCENQRQDLAHWISVQLQAPMPPSPFYVASVRLAVLRNDLATAHAQLAAGLKQTPGDLGLRALSVLLAETQDARRAAYEEAIRWQARKRLENAMRFFQSAGFQRATGVEP